MKLRILTPACMSYACDMHETCSEVVVIVNSLEIIQGIKQCSAVQGRAEFEKRISTDHLTFSLSTVEVALEGGGWSLDCPLIMLPRPLPVIPVISE